VRPSRVHDSACENGAIAFKRFLDTNRSIGAIVHD
jgi:hypothetical protein